MDPLRLKLPHLSSAEGPLKITYGETIKKKKQLKIYVEKLTNDVIAFKPKNIEHVERLENITRLADTEHYKTI